jgi:uncharacterized membrane protein YkoI
MAYTSQNGLPKIASKFHCMVSGEKRMEPCAGCTNPRTCISSTMQYKEQNNMANEPTVKLAADGTITCAKDLPLTECGYKVGQPVCGKCGAAAENVKSLEVSDDDSDGWVTADTDTKGTKMPLPEFEGMAEDEMDETPVVKRKKARKARLESMGMKSADWDDDAFICAFERKMYPGQASVCAQCPGGCAPEQDMPSLLEIEGIAQDMFTGKVLDSGYADSTDMFVVDVQRKDGKPVEAFFDGTTGECMGWHMLNEKVIGEIAEIDGIKVISFADAAEIATKSIEGDVISVDADMFEGRDAFAVEIDSLDGKSYDVFVSLDGSILGWDEYEPEEAADIDEEIADLALKAMYGEDDRAKMSESGEALPDGSYPIANEEDLSNAISSFGRAKDKEAAKAHIMKRAKELKLEDMIPEGWNSEKEASLEDTAEDAVVNDDTEEKSAEDIEATEFLSSLLEFEMLSTENDIEA